MEIQWTRWRSSFCGKSCNLFLILCTLKRQNVVCLLSWLNGNITNSCWRADDCAPPPLPVKSRHGETLSPTPTIMRGQSSSHTDARATPRSTQAWLRAFVRFDVPSASALTNRADIISFSSRLQDRDTGDYRAVIAYIRSQTRVGNVCDASV